MVKSKAIEHRVAQKSFYKVMDRLGNEEIDKYALFYNGFRTGMNYQKKVQLKRSLIKNSVEV